MIKDRDIAKIGDTIRTSPSGREFIVRKEEIDDHGVQWVWDSNQEPTIENCFSPNDYGVPNTNFQIIKRA